MDKIKYGLLASLASLLIYTQPGIAQDKKDDSTINLTSEELSDSTQKLENNLFTNYSLLTNMNTHQLNIENLVRKKIDFSFGFSIGKNKEEIDYLMNLRLSNIDN